jgi:hypothetical protein
VTTPIVGELSKVSFSYAYSATGNISSTILTGNISTIADYNVSVNSFSSST